MTGPFVPLTGPATREIAAAAYQDWWEAARELPFSGARETDPLAVTAYRWH